MKLPKLMFSNLQEVYFLNSEEIIIIPTTRTTLITKMSFTHNQNTQN